VAQALGRGVASAGLTVVSGLASGIDRAAHTGALESDPAADGPTPTIAVLPGGPEQAYPHSSRGLHRRIASKGLVLSELPPGTPVRRWMFVARNRLIAALSGMTVVVEAGEASGALITAQWAQTLDRLVGAVPGRVTSPQAQGPHGLLVAGAHLVENTQRILDLLFGAGILDAPTTTCRVALEEPHQRLLAELSAGRETAEALERAGLELGEGLAALTTLELGGYVRRWPGGRYAVVP
jgi:DNA processing protein